MKNIEVGIILGFSYVFGYFLHIFTMPKLLENLPLWKINRIITYVLTAIILMFVPIHYSTMPIAIFTIFIVGISIFKCLSVTLLTSAWLLLSDSIHISYRDSLEIFADEFGIFFKILGCLIGPIIYSACLNVVIPLPLLLCLGSIGLAWVIGLISEKSFPRFNICPYSV